MQEFTPDDATPSEEPAASDKPSSKDVGRVGIGMNVFLQTLLVGAILVGINYLAFRHYKRWDLTRGNEYTLSGTTASFLENTEGPLDLIVAFLRSSSLGQDVSNLVDEYQRQAPEKVSVTYIDPARDPDKLEEVKLQYGLDLSKNVVIVASGESSKVVKEADMMVPPTQRGQKGDDLEFFGEDAITSAMISVTEGSQRKLYILAGKGLLRQTPNGTAYDLLESFSRRQNASLAPLRLEDLDAIPGDADGIILVNALYDLTDREVGIIEDYWNLRRGGILILLNPEGSTPRLDGFLGQNGIHPRDDRVLYAESTGAGTKKQFQVQSTFSPTSTMTQAFWGLNTVFGGQTRSLRIDEGSEELQKRTIEAKPLLEAARRFWGETSYLEKLPTMGHEDQAPPIYVAASAELGALADERLRIDSSRMVVVGNATLADPDMQIASNYDFISACLNWLLDREELIGIPPKVKERHHISLSPVQHQRIFWIVAITLPGSMAALGFFIWTVRRG